MAVSLTWVRDNYDSDKDRKISSADASMASYHNSIGKITNEQLAAVNAAWANNTLLPMYSGTGTITGAAKGKIVNFSYPTSAKTNEQISIRASVQNTGTASGTFKLQLFKGTIRVAQSSSFSVANGQTSPAKSMYVTTPSSGASISYQIKCVRIT